MDERFVLDARERPQVGVPGRASATEETEAMRAAEGKSEAEPGSAAMPLEDPRALTILSTEHWSLLSARGLVYNEAFARAGMFLTFLSTTLVGLGLFSASSGFSTTFLVIVAVVLGVDLFVGLSSMGRIASASAEDIRMLQGMNRIRHAYDRMVPGLDEYFVMSKHDDMRGVFAIYGATEMGVSRVGAIAHGFTTVAGAVGVICATIAAVEAGVIAALLSASDLISIAVAVVTFAIGVGLSILTMERKIGAFTRRVDVRFPTPAAPSGHE